MFVMEKSCHDPIAALPQRGVDRFPGTFATFHGITNERVLAQIHSVITGASLRDVSLDAF